MHGVIDYTTAATLLAVPRMLGASPMVTRLMTQAAVGTVGYSMVTRYELSAFKLLPMKGHLALDAMQGLLMCGAPLLFPGESGSVRAALVGIGVFELVVGVLTKPEPPPRSLLESTYDAVERAVRTSKHQAREMMQA
jgi:hypothetical protein